MRAVVGDLLLWLGVAVALIACLGVLVMRDVYDRLHFTGPTVLAAILVAAAIWFRDGASLIADKATLTAVFVLVAGPLLTHATGRSARTSERGDWGAGIGDEVEVER